jgi:hypothetical protein
VLALGGVAASAYLGAVGSNAALTITTVADADLSLEIPDNVVANHTTVLQGDGTIKFFLTQVGIGPWSTYVYKDILIVDNDKPYAVYASVDTNVLPMPANCCMVIAVSDALCQIPFPFTPGSDPANWVILNNGVWGGGPFFADQWCNNWNGCYIYKYQGGVETEKTHLIAANSRMYVSMMICVPAGVTLGAHDFKLAWTAAQVTS